MPLLVDVVVSVEVDADEPKLWDRILQTILDYGWNAKTVPLWRCRAHEVDYYDEQENKVHK
jgi:hypothetical protein